MHQCLSCKKLYDDENVPVFQGCECGNRMFLFVKQPGDVERAQKIYSELKAKIDGIEQERKAPQKKEKKKFEFGAETIRVKDIGIYQINIDALMKGEPIIVLEKSGSYIISLPSAFKMRRLDYTEKLTELGESLRK